MSIKTYRIQYNQAEILDGEGFPLEFLSLAAAEFVVNNLTKLPEYVDTHLWTIVDSHGTRIPKWRKGIVQLRSVTDFKTDLFDCPVAFTGTYEQAEQYAKERSYGWKPRPNQLFGGFFVHPDTGDCLVPT